MNTGNYTAVFDPSVIAVNVPYFECYHIYVTAPVLTGSGTSIQIAVNSGYWDYNLLAQANGWDPAQPIILTPGDTLYCYFNVPTSNTTVPMVTCWFRYDIAFTGGVPING